MTRTVMSDKEWADLEKFGKKLKKEIQIRLLQSGKPVGVDMAFVRELNGAEIWTYDTDGASSKEVSWDLRLFYEDVYLKDGKTIEEIADEMATVGIEEYGRPLRQSLCPKEFKDNLYIVSASKPKVGYPHQTFIEGIGRIPKFWDGAHGRYLTEEEIESNHLVDVEAILFGESNIYHAGWKEIPLSKILDVDGMLVGGKKLDCGILLKSKFPDPDCADVIGQQTMVLSQIADRFGESVLIFYLGKAGAVLLPESFAPTKKEQRPIKNMLGKLILPMNEWTSKNSYVFDIDTHLFYKL